MATSNPNQDETNEETEPEPFVHPEGDSDEVNGIKGQLIYPDREVDAERAGLFAAGKVDTLYEDDDPDHPRGSWENPADRSTEEQTDEDDDKDEDE